MRYAATKKKSNWPLCGALKQIQFLFPERKITTNTVQEWCQVIKSKKTIRRILAKNFKVMFQGKLSYYVPPDEIHHIVAKFHTNIAPSLLFLLRHSIFGHVYFPFLPLLLRYSIFRHVYYSFLYRFCSATRFSGTYTTLFFTAFAPPLDFRARILLFLYRFCSATRFSGTYTTLSLPLLLRYSIFGHVYYLFFTVLYSFLQIHSQIFIFSSPFSFYLFVHTVVW